LGWGGGGGDSDGGPPTWASCVPAITALHPQGGLVC
jgi:hypothetical protein